MCGSCGVEGSNLWGLWVVVLVVLGGHFFFGCGGYGWSICFGCGELWFIRIVDGGDGDYCCGGDCYGCGSKLDLIIFFFFLKLGSKKLKPIGKDQLDVQVSYTLWTRPKLITQLYHFIVVLIANMGSSLIPMISYVSSLSPSSLAFSHHVINPQADDARIGVLANDMAIVIFAISYY